MTHKHVVLGRVSGLFGVKGWVKVYSYTRPPDNIFDYPEWQIGCPGKERHFAVIEARSQGKSLVARLADATGQPLPDRDAAVPLLDCNIAIARAAMPVLSDDEYYWFDLVGLSVVNRGGVALGRVRAMMETGASDVMVVDGDRERLIPFVVNEIVDKVDVAGGRIVVDWQLDF